MTTLTHSLSDSATMFGRQCRHMLRYPSLTFMLAGMPVVFLLLFVYVFGGTLGAGLAGGGGDRGDYINYVVPGIIMMTMAAAAQGTAISVAIDMTEGIVSRFRTMAISRASVLTGHVLGSMLQTLVGMVVVLAVAMLIGFRPSAGVPAWIALVGLLAAVTFALVWLSAALGLASKTVEEASNAPLPLILLPFLSSGFVPTDSMPAALRFFAEYQPFTSVIETVRALLSGGSIGSSAFLALGWCVLIGGAGYLWARALFNRRAARTM